MNAKTQAKKGELLTELRRTRAEIIAEASALSVEEQNTVFLGVWSVKDLLAHLVGWDYANTEGTKSVMAGKLPPFYNQHDRDWQTYNALLVRKYKRESLEELLALAKSSQHQLIEFLKTLPPEALNKDFNVRFRGYKVTIQRLLEAEIKDEQVHCRQIMDFFRSP